MRSLVFLLVLISGLILLSTCKKKERLDLCGDDVSKSIKWDTAVHTYPWHDPTWSTFLDGNSRVFETRSEVYTSVCPENDIYIEFSGCGGFIFGERIVLLEVQYCYGESGQYGGKQYSSALSFTNFFTFTITDAYGSNPGQFYLYIRWGFGPAKDIDTDFNYFKEIFSRTEVTIHYRQF